MLSTSVNPTSHRIGRRLGASAAALALAGTLALTGCGGDKSGSSASSAAGGDPSIQTSATTAPSDSTGDTSTATSTTSSTGTGTSTATSTGKPSSTHEGATPVTMNNLPPTSAFTQPGTFYTKATVESTYPGAGQAPVLMCQGNDLANWHPNAEFSRTLIVSPDAGGAKDRAGVQIASFATHADAVKAAEQMAKGFDCSPVASISGYVSKSLHVKRSTATLSGGQVAHLLNADYSIDDNEEAGGYSQLGVVATGTHVEMLGFDGRTQGGADADYIVRALNAALPALQR